MAFLEKRAFSPIASAAKVFTPPLDRPLPSCLHRNAEVVAGWRKRGKGKKQAQNFGYTTLLPDNVPQSTNI